MPRRPVSTRRFVRTLRLATAFAFLPAAAAIAALLAPFGGVVRSVAPLAVAAALLAPIDARVRFGFEDVRRPAWRTHVVVLFDVAWTAALLSPFAVAIVAVGAMLARLANRAPSATSVLVSGLALSFATAAYGVLIRRRWVRKRRVEVAIADLPPELDGYRIAHLSDLHVGSITSREEALRWVRRSNELEPDLAVVTGDVLTTGSAFHDDVVAALGELRAKEGVFGCLGNHDYYEEGALCDALAARGVVILRNEGVALRGGLLWLAGVEDVWRGRPDLRAALDGKPSDAPVVLLAHNPAYFPEARAAGVELVLAGHTHAGQIAVPFLVSRANLSRLATRWTSGLHREGRSQIFVHAGLGTTGPAIRLGAAPEVVEIVLRRA